MATILELKNLRKNYAEVRAVDCVSLSVEEGTCFGLLGPNGAGKTTTIEIAEGIIPQTSGEVLYKGRPRDEKFKEEVGIQFQNTELPQFLTVEESLRVYWQLYSLRASFEWLVETCALEEILKRDNRKISGGQKQRLLLAMAMANDPQLIFLDEPTTGLDPQARRHLWDIVGRMKAQRKTIVLTTHYMEEAYLLCDQIAIMDRGQVIAIGSPDELLKEHTEGVSVILPEAVLPRLEKFSGEYFEVQEGVQINTKDVQSTMRELMSQEVDLSQIRVRSSNLEDLFLKLTGKRLRA